ncbi:STAS domain-containing protein [Streptomyces rimosus]|uniref:STAS domain-containing protein n=1 Tax=Streptomyces rimosus TaxID=1927 RepID=UPI0004C8407E|nr:STAS domain-containing protein [Streptomyces rimosus]
MSSSAAGSRYHLLALTGHAPTAAARLASAVRLGATAPVVLVDVTTADDLDVEALGTLARLSMLLRATGGGVVLIGASATARQLTARTGTAWLLPAHRDVEAAVAGLPVCGRPWTVAELASGGGLSRTTEDG